jgi:hypothetical protein
MPEIREVEIDQIKIDVDEIQPRLGLLDEERVQILCEKYQEKGTEAFPLPVVFHNEDGEYWLASGHYRVAAIRKALSSDPDALRVVRVEVREGSKREAAFFAASANSEHGMQLTWAEMRRLVVRLLRDPQWVEIGDREIARLIGASHTYVNKIHHELDDQDESGNGCQIPPNPKRKVRTKRGGKPFNTTVDNTRRGRDPKAKTTTTPIQPDSPTVPQDEPIIVENKEHTAEAITPTDLNTLPNEPASEDSDAPSTNDHHEDIPTEDHDDPKDGRESDTKDGLEAITNDDYRDAGTSTAINTLKGTWSQATNAEQLSFLQWIIVHEKDEIHNKAVEALSVLVEQSNEDMR